MISCKSTFKDLISCPHFSFSQKLHQWLWKWLTFTVTPNYDLIGPFLNDLPLFGPKWMTLYSLVSLMNMRQLQILFNKARNWHCIVCSISWISMFLPLLAWCDHKIVQQIKTILWSHHASSGKNREIQLNQQTMQCQVFKA